MRNRKTKDSPESVFSIPHSAFRTPHSSWRSRLVVALVLAGWLALAGRLVQLQWVGRATFAQRASRQRSYTERVAARPGEIVDRNGRLLATTVTARSLFVDPSRAAEPSKLAHSLAAALRLDADRLVQRITEHRDRQFLWIRRRLAEDEVEAVRALHLPPGVWGFREEYLRRYPQGPLAAHILGLRNIDNAGHGGIEQQFDAALRGRDGRRVLVRDARGRVIEVQGETATPPQHGRTIVLTIDAVLQLYAERELDRAMEQWQPRGACAVLLDPRTCEVLALASRPTFDPNHPEQAAEDAWKNMAVAAIFEPGSTFKPFIVAQALDRGLIARDEELECEHGAYRMGGRILHDHHPYGLLSVTDVLVRSSNIGMAKIGERLTNDGLYAAALAFGFGSHTGIDLPGELPGLLRPLREWNLYSTGSVPMGQELAATPLQIITAHAALANGGLLMTPRIVLRQTDPLALPTDATAGQPPSRQIVSRVCREETARWLVQGPLREVVTRGTGRQARLDDYIVFGKTGTAQKPDPETGGYSATRYVSSFVGGAPADAPRLLVLVAIDEPTTGGAHYGGEVAAPTATRILHKALLHLRIPTRLARKSP